MAKEMYFPARKPGNEKKTAGKGKNNSGNQVTVVVWSERLQWCYKDVAGIIRLPIVGSNA